MVFSCQILQCSNQINRKYSLSFFGFWVNLLSLFLCLFHLITSLLLLLSFELFPTLALKLRLFFPTIARVSLFLIILFFSFLTLLLQNLNPQQRPFCLQFRYSLEVADFVTAGEIQLHLLGSLLNSYKQYRVIVNVKIFKKS